MGSCPVAVLPAGGDPMIHIIVAAILSLATHVDVSRARDIAQDVVVVSHDEPFFEGEAGAEATALLLVAIANVESQFLERIEQCRCRNRECDNGRSKGLFQIMRGDPAMCGDRRAQARAALAVLREAQRMCGDIRRTLGAYNSGRCQETRMSRHVHVTWQRLMRDAGVTWRNGRADWKQAGGAT